MIIEITNNTRGVVGINAIKRRIRECVELCIRTLYPSQDFEVSVLLTDNAGIQALNLEHRNIDKATDVLSFPMQEFDDEGNMIFDTLPSGDYGDCGDCVCLGDIVISLERSSEQAKELGHTLEREVAFLTIHSMLHLFGYDHTDDDESEMIEMQRSIMKELLF